MYKSEGLVEQHFHGAFGIDFMKCTANDIVDVSVEILKYGVTRIYPTLMTDDIGVIKEQIGKVRKAMEKQPEKSAKISGIHLEGPFINPEKSGIHEKKYILPPTLENYLKIEDEVIKIVTLAPELDSNGELSEYLRQKGVRVSCGHSLAADLPLCDCVTHLFNAMGGITHKSKNTATSALINDEIYTEVIADGNHIIPDVLKLIFRTKPLDKIILISDALPSTCSGESECDFAGQKVYLKNGAFYSANGILGGSGMLVLQIIQKLLRDKLIKSPQNAFKMASSNINSYMCILNNGFVEWDNDFNIINTEICKY